MLWDNACNLFWIVSDPGIYGRLDVLLALLACVLFAKVRKHTNLFDSGLNALPVTEKHPHSNTSQKCHGQWRDRRLNESNIGKNIAPWTTSNLCSCNSHYWYKNQLVQFWVARNISLPRFHNSIIYLPKCEAPTPCWAFEVSILESVCIDLNHGDWFR